LKSLEDADVPPSDLSRKFAADLFARTPHPNTHSISTSKPRKQEIESINILKRNESYKLILDDDDDDDHHIKEKKRLKKEKKEKRRREKEDAKQSSDVAVDAAGKNKIEDDMDEGFSRSRKKQMRHKSEDGGEWEDDPEYLRIKNERERKRRKDVDELMGNISVSLFCVLVEFLFYSPVLFWKINCRLLELSYNPTGFINFFFLFIYFNFISCIFL